MLRVSIFWIITGSRLHLKVTIKQGIEINKLSSFYLSYPTCMCDPSMLLTPHSHLRSVLNLKVTWYYLKKK